MGDDIIEGISIPHMNPNPGDGDEGEVEGGYVLLTEAVCGRVVAIGTGDPFEEVGIATTGLPESVPETEYITGGLIISPYLPTVVDMRLTLLTGDGYQFTLIFVTPDVRPAAISPAIMGGDERSNSPLAASARATVASFTRMSHSQGGEKIEPLAV